MSNTAAQRKRRELAILAVAGLLCTGAPLALRSALDAKVSEDLADRASERLGVPIELGSASVGLTGTLEIRDVRVGEVFHAERVMASIAPTGASNGLAPNELLVEGPSLRVRVDKDGNTSLDDLIAKRRSRISDTPTRPPSGTSDSKTSRLRTLRFVGGSLEVEVADTGRIESSGIQLWMRDGKVHALFGETTIDAERDGLTLKGTMPRGAVDYLRGYGLHRLLADGGTFSVKGPRGRAILRDLMVAAGIEDDSLQLSAQTGIDRATGSIKLEARETLAGIEVDGHVDAAPLAPIAAFLPESVEARLAHATGAFTASAAFREERSLHIGFENLHLWDLSVTEPALSRRQLDLDLWVDADAKIRQGETGTQVTTELGEVRSGDLRMRGTLSGDWPSGARIPRVASAELHLGKLPCDAALNSLPTGLRPSLAGLELRGSIESTLALSLTRSGGSGTSLEVSSGIDGCKVAAEPPVANTRSLRGAYEHRTPDGRTRVLSSKKNEEFVEYDDLPSYVPKAFVAAEDARFFKHEGFDPHQIERSLAIDMENGKLLRGGSTISQQLVKNLFLSRRRSLARKLQEAVLTWRLEDNLTKKRILEIYLNIIELGDRHTYGLTEAAQRWFGIPPSELSVLQTAFLAAMTPEPTSMSARIREAGGLDPVSASRVATILRVMKRSRVISSAQYQKAKSQRLTFVNATGVQRTAQK